MRSSESLKRQSSTTSPCRMGQIQHLLFKSACDGSARRVKSASHSVTFRRQVGRRYRYSGLVVRQSTAQTAITTIDTALDSVNSIRADYGASQNRLESSVNNMSAYVEALSSARARFMDADYAHETAEMTRLQVMQQAGVAALGQARSMNTSVIGYSADDV